MNLTKNLIELKLYIIPTKSLIEPKPDRSVVFSTNKTDHHDITELLLKVALNTINQPYFYCTSIEGSFHNHNTFLHEFPSSLL